MLMRWSARQIMLLRPRLAASASCMLLLLGRHLNEQGQLVCAHPPAATMNSCQHGPSSWTICMLVNIGPRTGFDAL